MKFLEYGRINAAVHLGCAAAASNGWIFFEKFSKFPLFLEKTLSLEYEGIAQ